MSNETLTLHIQELEAKNAELVNQSIQDKQRIQDLESQVRDLTQSNDLLKFIEKERNDQAETFGKQIQELKEKVLAKENEFTKKCEELRQSEYAANRKDSEINNLKAEVQRLQPPAKKK